VAIGMIAESEIAEHLGFCGPDVTARQRALLGRIGLPVSLPAVTLSDLWGAVQHDKKVTGGLVHCVFPERVGRVRIAPLERSILKRWFDRHRG
jgi:3-dehydroquinate synthase